MFRMSTSGLFSIASKKNDHKLSDFIKTHLLAHSSVSEKSGHRLVQLDSLLRVHKAEISCH